jgi:hypothetical protein|tara:strand:- start:947 stop:1126 length:180 start_codon:yes stop_codon:yes gene_type:complete
LVAAEQDMDLLELLVLVVVESQVPPHQITLRLSLDKLELVVAVAALEIKVRVMVVLELL